MTNELRSLEQVKSLVRVYHQRQAQIVLVALPLNPSFSPDAFDEQRGVEPDSKEIKLAAQALVETLYEECPQLPRPYPLPTYHPSEVRPPYTIRLEGHVKCDLYLGEGEDQRDVHKALSTEDTSYLLHHMGAGLMGALARVHLVEAMAEPMITRIYGLELVLTPDPPVGQVVYPSADLFFKLSRAEVHAQEDALQPPQRLLDQLEEEGKRRHHRNRLLEALEEYHKRNEAQYHHMPDGAYDSHHIWRPAETEWRDCCSHIQPPSERFPRRYLDHCKTLRHIAMLFNLEEQDLRKALQNESDLLMEQWDDAGF
jgi:hypothetical protein